VSHRASLDVSASVLKAVTGWIARHRRRPGSRPAQRAGTVHAQVTLVLRWLRHRLDLRTLAADAGLSIATAYRYLHEALDVIADHIPTLDDVLDRAHADNRCYNQLITALRAPAERGNALLGRWRALDRVTLCPQRIGAIAAAALVLTSLDRGSR